MATSPPRRQDTAACMGRWRASNNQAPTTTSAKSTSSIPSHCNIGGLYSLATFTSQVVLCAARVMTIFAPDLLARTVRRHKGDAHYRFKGGSIQPAKLRVIRRKLGLTTRLVCNAGARVCHPVHPGCCNSVLTCLCLWRSAAIGPGRRCARLAPLPNAEHLDWGFVRERP
jgi:hypothetical protein